MQVRRVVTAPSDEERGLTIARRSLGRVCGTVAWIEWLRDDIAAALSAVRVDERKRCAEIARDHECGAIECKGMASRIAAAIEAGGS